MIWDANIDKFTKTFWHTEGGSGLGFAAGFAAGAAAASATSGDSQGSHVNDKKHIETMKDI